MEECPPGPRAGTALVGRLLHHAAGIALAATSRVNLQDMLDRCCGFEIRSAALYRNFAAGARDQPDLCALWTAMAREEDDHARIINDARRHLPTIEAWMTQLSTRWDKVVREVEEKLSEAERLPGGAGGGPHQVAPLHL